MFEMYLQKMALNFKSEEDPTDYFIRLTKGDCVQRERFARLFKKEDDLKHLT